METINNVAAAASKAIFGENNPQATTQGNETHGQEPISGQQGKGTVNEPFDQGNSENPTSTTPGTSTYDNTSSGLTGNSSGFTGNSSSGLTGNSSSGLTGNSSGLTGDSSSGLTGNSSSGLTGDSSSGFAGNTSVLPDRTSTNDKSYSDLTSTNDNSTSNFTGGSTNDKSYSDLTGTSTNDRSASNFAGTSTNDNSSSNFTGTSTTDTTSSSTHRTGAGMSSSDFPNNPTSIAAGGEPNPHTNTDKTGVIAGREGDATKGSDIIPSERQSNPGVAPASGGGHEFKQQGADKPEDAPTTDAEKGAVKEKKDDAEDFLATKDPNDHSGEPMKMHGDTMGKTQAERRESKVGNPGGQEHKGESEGTGEQWVKTSGMAVDGGDFDATKPGAGREADRLLEEKGIHKTAPGQPTPEPAAGGATEGASKGDKPSMGQKLKDKLHLGHKDK